jgi:Ca2+-binding RTX toxin-like protein
MSRVVSRFLVTAMAMLLATAWLSASPLSARAAGFVSLTTAGVAYTQDFNTLNTLGTANAISSATGLGGWELTESGSGARDNEQYATGTGSSAEGDTYSFGSSSALLDRALGGLRGTTLVPNVGAAFTNNTGARIVKLDVAYTGEMYRAGVLNRNAADRLDFQLSLDATSLTSGTWTNYDALDFSSPARNTTVGAKDGNASAFRTALSLQITGLAIANGASFWIRWTDFDITGLDDGLAVDDFSITPRADDDAAPEVSATTPADGAEDVAVDADVSVTFSEPVDVAEGAFDVTCTSSGTHATAVSGGPTNFTIDPDTNFHQHEYCTVTVDDAGVTDTDVSDPPDSPAIDATFTFRVANPAPTFWILANSTCSPTLDGSFVVHVDDLETDPANLTVALTGNTNPALVPNANAAGAGNDRMISIQHAERKYGADVLTFTLSDGVNDVTFDINVMVGTNADETLTGTDGPDLLIGSNGADVLTGAGGADVLCGGNGGDVLDGGDGGDMLAGERGDDTLTGGLDADRFGGGTGTDTNTDVDAEDGDTTDGT